MEYSRQELVKCLTREIAMRQKVYARNIALGHMRQEAADREIDMMDTIRHHITNCNGLNGQMVLEMEAVQGDRSQETGAEITANCPQRALALVIQAFDEGVEQYGDVNTKDLISNLCFYQGIAHGYSQRVNQGPHSDRAGMAIKYAKLAGWYMCLSEIYAQYAEMGAAK